MARSERVSVGLRAAVHFVDRRVSLVIDQREDGFRIRRRGRVPPDLEVRIWMRSDDWWSALLGMRSLRRLARRGELVSEGRPSLVTSFLAGLDRLARSRDWSLQQTDKAPGASRHGRGEEHE